MTIYDQIASNKRRTWIFIFGFIIFLLAFGYLIGLATDYGYGPMFIAGVIAIAMSLGSYYYSDKLVLAIHSAKEVKFEDNKELYRLVENLCIGSGMPKPKLYIVDDQAPNAFATGRDPQHSAIAVTKGLLAKLNRSELEGVLAHELSHVQNYDIRLMTIVSVLAGTVLILSDLFIRWSWWGGARRRSSNRSGNQLQLILFVVAIVLAILAPIFAQIIKLAISRKREFLADASGALLTRYPEGLASALEKISQDLKPLQHGSRATAHLYISSPKSDDQAKKSFWAKLFETHPAVSERVSVLRSM